MLRTVADGVLIHESEFVQSNAIVVQGREGVLLIDPGVHGDEMACLADDLSESDQTVVAGFSTHPHWDHLLWHTRFGDTPRYGTERCAAAARDALSDGLDPRLHGIPQQVPLDLLGLITGLPPVTDLAKAAGIELPPVLGRIQTEVSTSSFTQPSAPPPPKP